MNIEFVVASHNEETFAKNIGLSAAYYELGYKFHVLKGFDNIPKAYNSIKKNRMVDTIYIYAHNDIFFPIHFTDAVKRAARLPKWGVLGVAGVRLSTKGEKLNFGHVLDRGREWGNPNLLPQPVQTLDEMVLITRGDIEFDTQFPQDFYGADICMQAQERGLKCYAIAAYCEHNSKREVGGRTPSFYESEAKFKEKWKQHLPIITTCSRLEP